MSFLERINLAVLAALVGVYGWYFSTVGGELIGGFEPGAALSSTNDKMFLAVGSFIILMIISSIVTAIFMGRESEEQDERDKTIDMRGDQRGGFALAVLPCWAWGWPWRTILMSWSRMRSWLVWWSARWSRASPS